MRVPRTSFPARKFTATAWLLVLCSCTLYKEPKGLINQRESFIWTSEHGPVTYKLVIDHSERTHYFSGRFIINEADTLYLRGMDKGGSHFTQVSKMVNDTTGRSALGHLFIWTIGRNADTVEVINKHDSIKELPIELCLYKKNK
jgi:hypothetical protein